MLFVQTIAYTVSSNQRKGIRMARQYIITGKKSEEIIKEMAEARKIRDKKALSKAMDVLQKYKKKD